MNDVFYKNMLKYLKWEDRNRFLNNEFLLCVVAVFSEAEVYGQTVEIAEIVSLNILSELKMKAVS